MAAPALGLYFSVCIYSPALLDLYSASCLISALVQFVKNFGFN
jgi:hypothetical protein